MGERNGGGGGEPEVVDIVAKGSNLIAVRSVCAETEIVINE
jgi:hypothetical protein